MKRTSTTLLGALLAALVVPACSGWVGEHDIPPDEEREQTSGMDRSADTNPTGGDPARPSPAGVQSMGAPVGGDVVADAEGSAADQPEAAGPVALPPAEVDPGFKGIHRLNNREYDNTVAELLGTDAAPARAFLNESAHGFDNIAASLGMTVAQYSSYFRAAADVVGEGGAELARALTECSAQAGSPECAGEIVSGFGQRAFRRPLSDAEQQTYLGVYTRARELDLPHDEAVSEVVRALLSSAEFLYRIEFDAEPASAEPHELSGYELASRLSYFLWSSMPDAALFQAARDGELHDPVRLDEHVARMLADERSSALVDSFTWQWLGMKDLESHAVLNEAYPDWDEPLRQSMLQEARLYLNEFVREGADWREFLTADFHFVDERLAAHYGDAPVGESNSGRNDAGQGFVRRVMAEPNRLGFMGLAGFLTMSSFAHRTSPTLRAKWILEELMCAPPPLPPADLDIPDLDAAELANQAASIDNVRERLELHRADPTCSSCHALLDPLGLALEQFDAVGRFRSEYTDGTPIDPSGQLPDGRQLDGLPALADVVNADDVFFQCTSRKLLTYALGRGLSRPDDTHLQGLLSAWREGDTTLRALVEHIVRSVPFRRRRGGGNAPSPSSATPRGDD